MSKFSKDITGAYGSLYERGLDLAEIAKRVRREIRDHIKAGRLPKGLKVSVRCSRYSMGQSLETRIVSVPAGMKRSEAQELCGVINAIANQYNYDRSDSMTDYYDKNFGGFCQLDCDLDVVDDRPRCLDCDSLNVYPPVGWTESTVIRCPSCDARQRKAEILVGLFRSLAGLPAVDHRHPTEIRASLLDLGPSRTVAHVAGGSDSAERFALLELDDAPRPARAEPATDAHAAFLASLGVA